MKTRAFPSVISCLLTILLLSLPVPGAPGAVALTTLYSFTNAANGYRPDAGLVQGIDGNLYGTTDKGGTGFGTIFMITTNGVFTNLYSFAGDSNGSPGISQLIRGSDGVLYGTAEGGGTNGDGAFFSIGTNGTPFTLLSSFPLFQGPPEAPLLESGGGFYGVTQSGGTNYLGSVFKLMTDGTFTNLYSFHQFPDGYSVNGGLVQDRDGNLYGTAQLGGNTNGSHFGNGTIFGVSTNLIVRSITILTNVTSTSTNITTNITATADLVLSYQFTNGIDGANPQGALVQGADGKLYGTTSSGGSNGFGTIFSITTNGVLTSLYSFTGSTNGARPNARLTLGNDGKFYGITPSPDTNSGTGTIFSFTTNGVYTPLFVFDDRVRTNGMYAVGRAPLIQGMDGDLYGVTSYGGSASNGGTIFRLDISGAGGVLPNITQQPPQTLAQFAGSTAMLSVSADNATAYQWFKSAGKTVNSSHISGATTSTLTISNLTTADSGSYHVVVSNLVGSVTSSNATLTVLIPDTTRPTLKVLSPLASQSVGNMAFTATGTAKDNAGIASVVYQLNSGDWTNASGTTNWTADITLVPGANVLRVYAVDTSTNSSTTNSVTFNYVVTAALTVQIVGQGTTTPNYNGALLAIGKTYSMTAKAAKGFKFQDWSGDANTNTVKLTFMMRSNLMLVANFMDVSRPLTVIKVPAPNQTVTNVLFATSGRASDNVGVTSVWFRLGSWPWFAATTTNGWTNWTGQYFSVNSGPNLVQAYAVDAAGNVSLTNSVKFTYTILPVADWAPDLLNGLLGQLQPSNGSPVSVGFDPANFTQTGMETNAEDYGVGSYIYSKLATNMASLTLTNYGPPPRTNVSFLALTFTNHYSGVFSNSDGDTGNLTVAIATPFMPATLVKKSIVAVDTATTNVSTIKLVDGTHFTQTSTKGGSGNGTYILNRFSPVGGLLSLSFSDGRVAELQLTFSTAKAGTYFATFFGLSGPPPTLGNGTFTLH